MNTEVSIKDLLEAGSHFGHQVSQWNPKMRPYIFSTKGGIHILDLDQTAVALKRAIDAVTRITAQGQSVLFVGTKPQAKAIIETEANRCGQFYINNRWLGGLMTNFKTIQASIDRLKSLEEKAASPEFEKYVKKERVETEKEIQKLNSIFFGIKTMVKLPGCLFIIDPKVEEIAKKEAKRLSIPIVAMVDTNCNPDGIDYMVPSNDDAIRSIQLITKAIADAAIVGAEMHQERLAKEPAGKEAGKPMPKRAKVEEVVVEGKAKAFLGNKPGTEERFDATDIEKYASSRVDEETSDKQSEEK